MEVSICIWVIGWFFSAGILLAASDDNAKWYITLLYALLMILIWPFFLGIVYSYRKV